MRSKLKVKSVILLELVFSVSPLKVLSELKSKLCPVIYREFATCASRDKIGTDHTPDTLHNK